MAKKLGALLSRDDFMISRVWR